MHHLTGGRTGRLNVNMTQMKQYKSTRSIISNKSVISHQSHASLKEHINYHGSKIIINVSGEVYETLESTLDKYPETLLGTKKKRALLHDRWKEEIFIDRHREAFEAILFFYQSSGNLVRPDGLSMKDFEEECAFYDIPDDAIKKMKDRECYLHKKKRKLPPRSKYSEFKKNGWIFFDHPSEMENSYHLPVLYATFSLFLILLSIAVFCLETELILVYDGKKLHDVLLFCHQLEMISNVYFMVELLARLHVHPSQKGFFKNPLNILEFLSFLLFIVCYPLPISSKERNIGFYASRMIRSIRIVRASRLSQPIKISTSVFIASINDVNAVCFVILILCIFGGSVMYYVEMYQRDTKFTSIPQSMWWSMQSLLCLGYGDIVPETIAGKAIGSVVIYFGVVTVTVLLLSLGGRLFDMYSKELTEKCFLPENYEKEDYEIHYQNDRELSK